MSQKLGCEKHARVHSLIPKILATLVGNQNWKRLRKIFELEQIHLKQIKNVAMGRRTNARG